MSLVLGLIAPLVAQVGLFTAQVAPPDEPCCADATEPCCAEQADAEAAAASEGAAILQEAIDAQNGAAIANELRDLTVSLYLETNDENGKIAVDAERTFEFPDRMWTRIREKEMSDTEFEEGVDGTHAWHRDQDGVTLLDGPDYKPDRKRIQQQVELTRLLTRFFFLGNLRADLTGLKKTGVEERTVGRGNSRTTVTADVLEGRGTVDAKDIGPATVRLWIARDTRHLVAVRIERDEFADHPLEFVLWHHKQNPQGVVVPGQIQLFERNAATPTVFIALKAEDEEGGERVNGIRFNTDPDDALFAPPDPDDED